MRTPICSWAHYALLRQAHSIRKTSTQHEGKRGHNTALSMWRQRCAFKRSLAEIPGISDKPCQRNLWNVSGGDAAALFMTVTAITATECDLSAAGVGISACCVLHALPPPATQLHLLSPCVQAFGHSKQFAEESVTSAKVMNSLVDKQAFKKMFKTRSTGHAYQRVQIDTSGDREHIALLSNGSWR